MRKGRVVAMIAVPAAAIAGFLHLRKRRSGDADSSTSSPMEDSMTSMTESSTNKLRAKKSPATA